MNRKGSERRLLFLFSMSVLGFAIAIGLINGIYNFLDDTTYWKIYYARDLGLMMDAAMMGKGNIELNYDFTDANKPLVLRLKDRRIEVYDYNPEVKEPIIASFRYASNNNIEVVYNELFSQFFTIRVSPYKVEVFEETPKKEFCPDFNTNVSNPQETSIKVIYQNHSYIQTFIESGLSEFKVRNLPLKVNFTLILEKKPGNLTLMYYYQEPQKSEKMSCLIRNQIIDADPDMTLSSNTNSDTMYFAELQRLKSDSELVKSLERSDFGLVIQASDFNKEVATAITKGVAEYYGRSR